MVEKAEIKLGKQDFPSHSLSDTEKKDKSFGLQVGQAIQYEWFRNDKQSCKFYDRQMEFNIRRLYAIGEQSVSKYKNELAVDGDLSYLNLDWTPVPIIPKFVDIVVNGMSDRLFKVKAYSQDALSRGRRNDYHESVKGQMIARPFLDTIKDKTGVNPFTLPEEDIPNSDEELDLHMQIKYKPSIEIAEEEAINTILAENHYDDIRKRLDYDQVVLGMSVGKHEFLRGSGVEISYVDPASVVHSYTEDPNFKDCFYWGEVKQVPLGELYKINPDLTKDDIKKISSVSQAWYNAYNLSKIYDGMFSKESATLMYFSYKTTKHVVYKKKILDNGGQRVIEKDDTFNPPEEKMKEGNFVKIDKEIDVWYEGVMVMGTDYILKWEMAENMVKPKSASQHAYSNYVACAPRTYKGAIDSLVKRMIPFGDHIQITHLKLQQITNKTVPDGVFIDADGLSEVDLGNGQAYNPEDALRLYFQTGSVIGRSFTEDGEFNHAKVPIKELNSSSGANKAQMLISNYNHYLNMIRTVTGLNEARDGTSPDPKSLVGVQKLAALNSNTATRHVLDASIFIYRTMAEAMSCRISDILQYAEFKEDFINKIGKSNVTILEEIATLYLYDFGIFIEVAPDEEEKTTLEANIQMALSKGNIDIEDAIDIREIRNIKLANQLLKLRRKEKQEREERLEMEKQQMQAQINMQSQQAAKQAAMEKTQMEFQAKSQLVSLEGELGIKKMEVEARLKSSLMAEEFNYNLKLAEMNGQVISDREDRREVEKSKRISQQNTEQSKLIEQKEGKLPPINFESNEDSLDGFNLAPFAPR